MNREKINVEFLLQPQLNMVRYTHSELPEPYHSGYEYGLNGGFLFRYKVSGAFSVYGLISSGPHYISVSPYGQASGFNFSDNFLAGTEIKISRKLALDLRAGFRHVSNLRINLPNKGIDDLVFKAGILTHIARR